MTDERLPAEGTPGGVTSPVRRILVVEDSEDLRDLMQLYLQGKGYEVQTAADGTTAVALLLASRHDVAFVDVGLPDIDGYEVARRVRAQPEGRGLLLVALTGHRGPAARAQATEAGFDVHLVKPVELAALNALLSGSRPAV